MRKSPRAAFGLSSVATLFFVACGSGTPRPVDNGDPQDAGTLTDDLGPGQDMTDAAPPDADGTAALLARAKVAVGYSYYWGHGAWRTDNTEIGSCSGSCPSCTHTGLYGADCSGLVAKLWEVPKSSAPQTDEHPYSTYNFYYEHEHWIQEPRSSIQPGDAYVYRNGGAGHIALFESGADPYGAVWLYEARGCATGVVHDLRTVNSSYIAIARTPRL